ncbi:MAG TPA: bacillithiol biosynthesis BshC, partial [Eudoraea sp.]|nr:bacillithiol biosynthesis BshC [Eudoraea sp.]
MESECIPFRKTGYFPELICDYLEEKDSLRPFYHRYATLEEFGVQISEKKAKFSQKNRQILHDVLVSQYRDTTFSKKVNEHIAAVNDPNTFTVVTGHQLNLFTGPLYFLYKIVSTINLTLELKKAYPDYQFVPVYWMATEDHDFEEINFFNFKGKKLQWNKESGGAVGMLDTEGLDAVYDLFSQEVGNGKNAEKLKELFHRAYIEHRTLTAATRYLANALFGEYGLVIIDGDDTALKRLLIPYAKRDLLENITSARVGATVEKLSALPEQYGIQVSPREINYFYLTAGGRERIVQNEGQYRVINTNKVFKREEILE